MRDFALVLLLATATSPALASGEGDHGGRDHRGQSSAQTESRPQPATDSSPPDGSEDRAIHPRRTGSGEAGRRDTRERLRAHYQQGEQEAVARSDGEESPRIWRRGTGEGASSLTGSSLRPRERQIRTIPDTQPAATTQRRGSIDQTFGGRVRSDYRDGSYTRWSNHWRRDHRYDWRRHRDRHRSIFRLGFYYDPFGWNYRRWSTGSFLYPSYYGSNFWLHDPWQYRLPRAYGPYRWVRYWDDALLVNIYTGQVVDVIHNFFW